MKIHHLLVIIYHLTIVNSKTVQRSRLGCRTAYYMLTNSIPLSCNTALDHINMTLLNISSSVIDYGDICNPYCLTPLRQAALECPAIHEIYTSISSLCCYNDQRQRCFSLAGHTTLVTLVTECGQYINTTTRDNCSNTCSEAMTEASQVLGCCLPTLLTSYDGLLETTLWHWCMAEDPDEMCIECNVAMTTTGQVILVAVAIIINILLSCK